MADRPPYHVLQAQVAILEIQVENLEKRLVAARRDPREYRRGYIAGHAAAQRGAPATPDRRRVRWELA